MQDSLDSAECCWICLEGSGELVRPCRCPRRAHRPCLARWQLHCAGKLEEKKCRFCKESLPDWRQWLGTSSSAPQHPPARRQLTDPPNAQDPNTTTTTATQLQLQQQQQGDSPTPVHTGSSSSTPSPAQPAASSPGGSSPAGQAGG
ncbi:MAG: hypothetical protein WDW36_000657 [Sanguina aurantia]